MLKIGRRAYAFGLALAVILSVLTGCGSGDRPTGDYWFQDGVTENPQESSDAEAGQDGGDSDGEDTELPMVDQNAPSDIPAYTPPEDAVAPVIIEYDSKWARKPETSIYVDVISFPTTQNPTGHSVEEFYTEAEFVGYLDKYSDLQDNSEDTLVIKTGTFAYQHESSTYSEHGKNLRFFFVSIPYLSPWVQITAQPVLYDEETKSAFIVLEEKGDDYTEVERFNADVVSDINTKAKGAYVILAFEAEALYGGGVEHIYIMRPSAVAKRIEAAKGQETSQPTSSPADTGSESEPDTEPEQTDAATPATTIPEDSATKAGNVEVVEPDASIEAYQEMYGVRAAFVSIPSTQVPDRTTITQVFSIYELEGYLSQYSDIQDNSEDSIIVASGQYQYRHGNFSVAGLGGNYTYFFVSSRSFEATASYSVQKVYCNKETSTMYLVLKADTQSVADYELNETVRDEVEQRSKAVYGLVIIDGEYTDGYNNLQLVLPE